VASEQQIKANRRNAAMSTGPRSAAGKKRAGRNAYRHGLSLSSNSDPAVAEQVGKLARQIAGNTTSENVLQPARDAAEALLDLARIQQIKIAWMDRVLVYGDVEGPGKIGSEMQYIRVIKSMAAGNLTLVEPELPPLMPPQDPERTAEAVRRSLSELIKLDRYEARTRARRDRAIRKVMLSRAYS
jgi:hypothetical protein